MDRIDKILAHEGFGSRKDIKKLLRSSEVLVNGKQIYNPAEQVDTEKDIICVDGEQLNLHGEIYLMMNKITNTISSAKDGQHQTVFDLLEDKFRTPYLADKLHIVGRLDLDTEGLLLFTTDGELTHRLISPKTHVSKTYFCILRDAESGEHKKEITRLFEEGIEVGPDGNEDGFKCAPASIEWCTEEIIQNHLKKSSFVISEQALYNKAETETSQQRTADEYSLQNRCALLTIYEGKYHQVKRMFEAAGNKIVYLKRISMGKLLLDNSLEPGKYRELSEEEIDLLKINEI